MNKYLKSILSTALVFTLVISSFSISIFNVMADSAVYSNIALSSTVEAETPTWAANAGYDYKNLNDGEINQTGYGFYTSTYMADASAEKTITMTFDKAYKVNEVILYGRNKNGYCGIPEDFTIEVWNGSNWVEVASKTGYDNSLSSLSVTFGATDCRALRLISKKMCLADGGPNYAVQLIEMEIMGSNAEKNLPSESELGFNNIALSSTVEAETPSWAAAKLHSGNLIDGVLAASGSNFYTSTYETDATKYKTILITFDKTYKINEVILYARNNSGYCGIPEDFTIEAWKGSEWVEVASKTGYDNSVKTLSVPFDAVDCRAVRLVSKKMCLADGGPKYAIQIAEMEVMGSFSYENIKTPKEFEEEVIPHPADGIYDSWTRTIEFDKYVVSDNNCYTPVGEEYGEYSGVPYFSIIDDPDESGDKILHYYNHSASSWWYPNWTIHPTVDGSSSSTKDAENCNVLDTDSTYKLNLRIRVNDLQGGNAQLLVIYSVGNAINAQKEGTNCVAEVIDSNVTETDGEWVDLVAYFRTPAEYSELTGGVANRAVFALTRPGAKVNYDLDTMTLTKVTQTNLYVKENGDFVLRDSLKGEPGEELVLPEYYSEESYSSNDCRGDYSKVVYGDWYGDEDCTTEPVMKYANCDVNIYCNNPVTETIEVEENQEMFVGFDVYTQRTEGLLNARITNELYNTGSASLKAVITPDSISAFELKNDHALDISNGKTYRADFAYKSDESVTFGIGLANGSVESDVIVKESVVLEASSEWTTASVVFTADDASDDSVVAVKLTSSTDATIYLDTFVISSATESVGVEKETTDKGEQLRFMFNLKGKNESAIVLAGEEFAVTEHGVLVKGSELDTELSLKNKDVNGIYTFSQSDLSKNYSVNPVTGNTVYSVSVNGFEVDDTYKVSARGYIKLSDGTVYYTDILTASVSDILAASEIIPENANISDYYVYLPVGTSFPADRTYSITTYDEMFGVVSVLSGDILTESAYVLFDSIPDFSRIIVPSELKYLVHGGAKSDLYFGANAQIVSKKIDSVGNDTVNYLFVTDIHFDWDVTDPQGAALINQTKLMTKMANENDNIDFVVIGGDTVSGMYGSKEDCINSTQTVLDPFLECTKPVFVLMGNHDDNSYHTLNASNTNKEIYVERVISDLDWENSIINRYTNRNGIKVTQDDPEKRANSKYYYYDLENKKTRIIALDAIDYEAKYDENGNILGDTDNDGILDGMPICNINATTDVDKYYSGKSYWGYSADQVRWLAEDALGTLPSDYDVIFVSHMGIDRVTNSYGIDVFYGNDIRNVLKAFKEGGTYNAEFTDLWGNPVSVNTNFADKNGKIISWQFGHQHIELSHYENDVDIWQICTLSANVNQSGTQTYEDLALDSVTYKNIPWRVYPRELNEITEASFNVMSVSKERVYRFTVGEGNNEKLIYPE